MDSKESKIAKQIDFPDNKPFILNHIYENTAGMLNGKHLWRKVLHLYINVFA